jgi:ketosteroid isomerase-like protein
MIGARLVERRVRRAYAGFDRGDPSVALRAFGEGSSFTFGGCSPLAAELTGREQIDSWFAGLMRLGLEWEVEEVIVSGPPWAIRIVTRYTSRARGPDGLVEMLNRGVQYARFRWFKVAAERVYPDTAEFDRWLSGAGPVTRRARASA